MKQVISNYLGLLEEIQNDRRWAFIAVFLLVLTSLFLVASRLSFRPEDFERAVLAGLLTVFVVMPLLMRLNLKEKEKNQSHD